MTDHTEPKELVGYYDTHEASAELEGAAPEPASTTEPMVTYALRLPKPVLDRLRAVADAVADARSEKVTTLMRSWLKERLVSEETVPPVSVIDVGDLITFLAEQSRPVERNAPAMTSTKSDVHAGPPPTAQPPAGVALAPGAGSGPARGSCARV
jgi:hypothetical protein